MQQKSKNSRFRNDLCCSQALPTVHQLQHDWSPAERKKEKYKLKAPQSTENQQNRTTLFQVTDKQTSKNIPNRVSGISRPWEASTNNLAVWFTSTSAAKHWKRKQVAMKKRSKRTPHEGTLQKAIAQTPVTASNSNSLQSQPNNTQ